METKISLLRFNLAKYALKRKMKKGKRKRKYRKEG
jgi:hypothetical protein